MQLSDGAEVNSSLTSWLPVVVESFSVCMLSLLHVQDFFPERLILLTYSNFRPTPRHRCFYRSNTCLYRSHLCIWCNTKNKFLIANVGDIRDESSISGLGWSPGRGHGNPLQYTCLENPICDFEPGGPQSTGSQRVRYDLRWLEKAMAPHSSTLAWKIPWTEEPCRLQSMRSLRVTTEQLHFHFSLLCIGKGNGNLLQCSCLENPRDGGAWWAAVYGVAQSRTRLKRLSSSSSGSSSSSSMQSGNSLIPHHFKKYTSLMES